MAAIRLSMLKRLDSEEIPATNVDDRKIDAKFMNENFFIIIFLTF